MEPYQWYILILAVLDGLLILSLMMLDKLQRVKRKL
jgi:hypothetical protein